MADDILTQLKDQLSFWRADQTYITGQSIEPYSQQFHAWLKKLEEWGGEARIGLALLTEFMELDQHIMEYSHDDGMIRDVFVGEATMLFGKYARLCPDREFVVECFQKLLFADHYGFRSLLFSLVVELPEPDYHHLLAQIKELEGKDMQWSFALKTLLGMTQAGEEEIKRRCEQELRDNQQALALAALHLSRGDLEESQRLCRLQNRWYLPDFHEGYRQCCSKRDQFMRDFEVWQRFVEGKSAQTLRGLVEWREGKYKESAASYCEKLLWENRHSGEWLLEHLMGWGRFEVVAYWLIANPSQIKEQGRGRLSLLADEMRKRKHYLEAICILRCLVEKYLVQRNSHGYALAVKTLHQLAEMDVLIQDWGTVVQPEAYMAQFKERHGHKRSFWQRFNGEIPC